MFWFCLCIQLFLVKCWLSSVAFVVVSVVWLQGQSLTHVGSFVPLVIHPIMWYMGLAGWSMNFKVVHSSFVHPTPVSSNSAVPFISVQSPSSLIRGVLHLVMWNGLSFCLNTSLATFPCYRYRLAPVSTKASILCTLAKGKLMQWCGDGVSHLLAMASWNLLRHFLIIKWCHMIAISLCILSIIYSYNVQFTACMVRSDPIAQVYYKTLISITSHHLFHCIGHILGTFQVFHLASPDPGFLFHQNIQILVSWPIITMSDWLWCALHEHHPAHQTNVKGTTCTWSI